MGSEGRGKRGEAPLSHASGYATAVACEKQFINNNLVSGL